MSAEGVPQAFCPLLWVYNGGRMNAKGRPMAKVCSRCQGTGWTQEQEACEDCEQTGFDQYTRVVGCCDRPYDCATRCELMENELRHQDPSMIWWLCPPCVLAATSWAKAAQSLLALPGHYTEGPCQSGACERPGSLVLHLRPRESGFLQLVLGPLPFQRYLRL